MAVSPEDVVNRLRAEARLREGAARARASAVRAKLDRTAEILRAAGARRIWLFGSLASGVPHIESDVDLAVEGLPRARYFDALAAIMTLLETRVDLVALEGAPGSLRERIVATGREL